MSTNVLGEDASNARTQLLCAMRRIKDNKPKPSGMKLLNPFDDSDWEMIKSYDRMNKKVKESFTAHMTEKEIIRFGDVGPCGPPFDNVLANRWHKLLKDKVEKKWNGTGPEIKNSLLSSLKEKLGIEVVVGDFPLYGFMCRQKKLQHEVYLWQGDVDAIGWFYNSEREQGEYVIIDWKIKRDLLNFWKSPKACGMYLHQCLVCAKLLQLQMSLDYLPSVLLVPISSHNGKDMYPGHFLDYPDECKEKVNMDSSWTTEIPSFQPEIYWERSLFKNAFLIFCALKGDLNEHLLLTDIFDDDAKLGDLLKALGMEGSSLKVIEKKPEED